jgi:hypothetical protein
MSTTLDPGLELDTILGFAGASLMAYGLGAKNLVVAGSGALLAGWFGTLTLIRVVTLAELVNTDLGAVNGLNSLFGGSKATTNTNGQSQGTP